MERLQVQNHVTELGRAPELQGLQSVQSPAHVFQLLGLGIKVLQARHQQHDGVEAHC